MVNTRSRKGKEKASSSNEPPVDDMPVEEQIPDDVLEGEEEEELDDDDELRFQSKLAKAIWRQLIHHAIHREKALLVNHEPIGPLLDKHDWRVFVNSLPNINVTWVQEFYASAVAHARDTFEKADRLKHSAVVRGRWVRFKTDDIKHVLRLPAQPQCGYSTMFSGRTFNVTFADVLSMIAFEGTTWEGTFLPRPALNSDGHYWYEFVRHWLLPTMNPSEVTRHRGLLVYAIMSGAPINVVSLIYKSLMANIKSLASETSKKKDKKRKKSPLIYPTLIHLLCKDAGVPEYEGDSMRAPATDLAWEEKVPGAEPKRARTTDSGRATSSSSARPVTLASLQQSVEQMRIDQLEVRARIEHQEREMGPYLGRYMREMMLYSDRVRGLAAIDYPYPPAFPTYTPSREDAETAERDDAPDEAADMDDAEE